MPSPPSFLSTKTLITSGFLILALYSSYFFFYNLGESSVSSGSDEVIYVRVAQSTLHDKNVFPLLHGTSAFFEKPPLKFWLAATTLALLGESNFAFRALDGLLGALSVLLAVLFTYRFAKQLGSYTSSSAWIPALIVGFLLFGVPEWIIMHHSFRRAVLDGLLTFFTLLMAHCGISAYCYLTDESTNHTRGRALLFIAITSLLAGAATLTKSVAGLVPLFCIAAACAPLIKLRELLKFTTALSVGPLIFLTYIGVLSLHGRDALNSFIGIEILERVTDGFSGHNTGQPFYYLKYLFVRGGIIPAFLLVIGLCGAIVGSIYRTHFRFLLALTIVPVFLYSLASAKVPWYLNPFAPFICITGVLGTSFLFRSINQKGVRIIGTLLLLTLSVPAYYRAVSRHALSVATTTTRIPIDLLSESLAKEGAKVAFMPRSIRGSTATVKRRFNLEGIYRDRLLHGSSRVDARAPHSWDGFSPRAGEYVFVNEADLSLLPEGGVIITELPPFLPRMHTVKVVQFSSD